MLEVMGIITMGLLWLAIAMVIGIGVGRSCKRQNELPLAKFPVLFKWRLNPSHDLREVVIAVNGDVIWRGVGTQAKVHLSLGYSEVVFYYIDKDETMTKETVDCSLDSDGRFQSYSRELEQYPVRAAKA